MYHYTTGQRPLHADWGAEGRDHTQRATHQKPTGGDPETEGQHRQTDTRAGAEGQGNAQSPQRRQPSDQVRPGYQNQIQYRAA